MIAPLLSRSRQSTHNAAQTRAVAALDDALRTHRTRLQDLQAANSLQLDILREQQALSLEPKPLLEVHAGSNTSQALSVVGNPPEDKLGKRQDDEDVGIVRKRQRRLEKYSQQRRTEYRTRISFAAWITGRIWELAAKRAEGCWNLSIRIYNFVPGESPIFDLCRFGDLEAVRDLLVRGKASMLDCTEDETTPLMVSVSKEC